MAVPPATFRSCTDELLNGVSQDDLAGALGCSIPTLRQARLSETAKARRSPPQGWESVVAKLAEKKAEQLKRLAAKLRAI